MRTCETCGAGSYSANVLSCEPCQIGEYCPEGSKVGIPCPPGSTTDGRGATSKGDCGCYAGLYDASGSQDCLECTEGMNCTVANTGTQDLPQSLRATALTVLTADNAACYLRSSDNTFFNSDNTRYLDPDR